MKQIIKDVLNNIPANQINLTSKSAKEFVAAKIAEALKSNGIYYKGVHHKEKNKLSEEIVDNKDGGYIYESLDGGKTIYKRKFGEYDNREKISKEQRQELNQLAIQMTEDATSVRLDYEQSGSNLDSGSVIEIHQNSPLLYDEKESLGDVAYEVRRKKNE